MCKQPFLLPYLALLLSGTWKRGTSLLWNDLTLQAVTCGVYPARLLNTIKKLTLCHVHCQFCTFELTYLECLLCVRPSAGVAVTVVGKARWFRSSWTWTIYVVKGWHYSNNSDQCVRTLKSAIKEFISYYKIDKAGLWLRMKALSKFFSKEVLFWARPEQ